MECDDKICFALCSVCDLVPPGRISSEGGPEVERLVAGLLCAGPRLLAGLSLPACQEPQRCQEVSLGAPKSSLPGDLGPEGQAFLTESINNCFRCL